jgi:hypothetical protein
MRYVGGDFVLSSAFLRATMASLQDALNLNLAAHSIHKHFARVKIAHSDLAHGLCVHRGVVGDLIPVQ